MISSKHAEFASCSFSASREGKVEGKGDSLQFLRICTVLLMVASTGCSKLTVDAVSEDEKAIGAAIPLVEESIVQYMTQYGCLPERIDQLDLSSLPEGVTANDFDYSIVVSTNGAESRSSCVLKSRAMRPRVHRTKSASIE